MGTIRLDNDLTALNDYRYNALKEVFGKEVADTLVDDYDMDLDADIQKVVDASNDVFEEE